MGFLDSLRTLRNSYLIFLYVLAFFLGLQSALPEANVVAILLMRLALAIAVVKACALDGQIIGKKILRIHQFLMLLTWPVTAPVYLVWARGWKGLLWLIILAVTLFIVFVIGAIGASLTIQMASHAAR